MLIQNHNQGQKSEALFRNICVRDKIEIRKSSSYEDRYQHIDFFVKLKTQSRSIDIKSTKKIKGKLQDDMFYIELANDGGNDGWIYAETMCLVGFECFENYMIYRRDHILDYIISQGIDSFQSMTRQKDKSLCILLPKKNIEHLVYYILYK
tara:strand:+ start:2203 stop:2655 length:453 start_codon:yes stop_codon:yes gene_type:complete